MPVTSDTARAISILASLLWAAGVAGARQYRLELGLDHRLDELAHPIAQADFDRIKPIVEKMDRRLGLRLQGCRVRAIAGHGVVSTGAQTPGLLGVQHPETTPPSIPTPPRTAPTGPWPGLPHRRAGQPMRPPVHVGSARQHSGEPSSGLGPNSGRNDRLRGPDLARLDGEIAGVGGRAI